MIHPLFDNWLSDFTSRIRYVNYTEGEVIYFGEMIKFFINKSENHSKFSLFDISSSMISRSYSINQTLKNKFIDVIVESSDDILNIAATSFSSSYDKDYFLLLLDSLKNKNHPKYHEYVDLFIRNQHFSNNAVTYKFLSIINQNHSFIIDRLLCFKNYTQLLEYLSYAVPLLQNYQISSLCQQLYRHYNYYNTYPIPKDYYQIVDKIVQKSTYFDSFNFNYLCNDYNRRIEMGNYCINNYYNNNAMATCFAYYLFNIWRHEYDFFEERFIATISGIGLQTFASTVSFCSKRKFLNKIVAEKNPELLSSFLRTHPEFNKLLPMM